MIVSASGPIASRSGSRRTRPRRRVSRSRNWPPSAKMIVKRFHAGLRGVLLAPPPSRDDDDPPAHAEVHAQLRSGVAVRADGLAPHRLALAVGRDEPAADAAPARCRRGGAGGTPTRRCRRRRRSCGRARSSSVRRARSTSGSSGTPPVSPAGPPHARRERSCGDQQGLSITTTSFSTEPGGTGWGLHRLDAVWSPLACAPPSCVGRRWLNTGGAELSLAELPRQDGAAGLLDVLLRQLPARARRAARAGGAFADVLVTVGVHSPKFVHEAEPAALAAAVERYGVHHPVLDDPELDHLARLRRAGVADAGRGRSQGYVVAHLSGEGHATALGVLVEELVAAARAKGTLHRGDGPYVAPPEPATDAAVPGEGDARCPAARSWSPTPRTTSSSSWTADLETQLRAIGTGERGPRRRPAPSSPSRQGLAVLPPDVAARRLRRGGRRHGQPRAARACGWPTAQCHDRGRNGCAAARPGAATATPRRRSSCPARGTSRGGTDGVVVAMAGSHQLWTFDPARGATTVLAGTTNEGLRDGPAGRRASSPSPRGSRRPRTVLWMADAETSALRWLDADRTVTTAVGAGPVRLRPPRRAGRAGAAAAPARRDRAARRLVAVADTYNGAIRRYDPATRRGVDAGDGLAEPSDLLVDGETLIVVESAAHRLVRVPVAGRCSVDGAAHPVRRPPHRSRGRRRDADASAFTPPTGQHLDTGSATRRSSPSPPIRRSCWSAARAPRPG